MTSVEQISCQVLLSPFTSKNLLCSNPATFKTGVNNHVKMKPRVVFILGPPGSGKGTQSAKIVKFYGFAHLSAGDLLREELKLSSSTHGDVIKKHIDAGTIVPVEITCALLKRRIDEYCSNGVFNFLIDGFPRNWDNVSGWESTMTEFVDLAFVLYLDAPEDVCITRCLNRCDGSGRTDDNLECLKKRLHTFKEETLPIINYFINKDVVRKVDSAKPEDEVFVDIQKIIDDLFPQNNLLAVE